MRGPFKTMHLALALYIMCPRQNLSRLCESVIQQTDVGQEVLAGEFNSCLLIALHFLFILKGNHCLKMLCSKADCYFEVIGGIPKSFLSELQITVYAA